MINTDTIYREYHNYTNQLAETVFMLIEDDNTMHQRFYYQHGQISEYTIFKNGRRHGEHKAWFADGTLREHYFYVYGKHVSFDEIPFPITPEDHLYFKLKYDLPLQVEKHV